MRAVLSFRTSGNPGVLRTQVYEVRDDDHFVVMLRKSARSFQPTISIGNGFRDKNNNVKSASGSEVKISGGSSSTNVDLYCYSWFRPLMMQSRLKIGKKSAILKREVVWSDIAS